MKTKLLTIFIPAYNAENYLNRCLDSFLNSHYLDNIEVIIVNDGSKDSTQQIANEYVEKYSETFQLINKVNGHVGSVYNAVLNKAKGKYIRELDADDWIDYKGLDKLLQYIEDTNVDVIFTNFDIVNEKEEYVRTNKCLKDNFNSYGKELYLSDFAGDIKLAMHGTTYKTSVFNSVKEQFDEKCYYVDTEYNLYPLVACKSFVALDFSVYKYLLGTNEQSMNKNNMIKNIEQHKRVSESCINYYTKYIMDNSDLDSMIFEYVLDIVSMYIRICFYIDDYDLSKKHLYELMSLIETKYTVFYNRMKNNKNHDHINIAINMHKNNYSRYAIKLNMFRIKKRLKIV